MQKWLNCVVIIKSAQFLTSNTELSKLPSPSFPEFAFAGRSNVGKSSLINMLCERKIAKTSQTPGKTRLINHFLINESWYLADLPGYGYAKVSKTERSKWTSNSLTYLKKRGNLCAVFQLIDSRLPPQQIDLDFTSWLIKNQLIFYLIFTKIDKLTKRKMDIARQSYLSTLPSTDLPAFTFLSSSESKAGRHEILELITELNAKALL